MVLKDARLQHDAHHRLAVGDGRDGQAVAGIGNDDGIPCVAGVLGEGVTLAVLVEGKDHIVRLFAAADGALSVFIGVARGALDGERAQKLLLGGVTVGEADAVLRAARLCLGHVVGKVGTCRAGQIELVVTAVCEVDVQGAGRICDIGNAHAVVALDEARIQRAAVGQGEDEVALFIDCCVLDAAHGRFGLFRLLDLGERVDGERRGLHRRGGAVRAELPAHDLRVDVEGEFELLEILDGADVFEDHGDLRDVARLDIVAAALGVGRVDEIVLGAQRVGHALGDGNAVLVVVADAAEGHGARTCVRRGARGVGVDEGIAGDAVDGDLALIDLHRQKVSLLLFGHDGKGSALIQPFAEFDAAHGVDVCAERCVHLIDLARGALALDGVERHILGDNIPRKAPCLGEAAVVPIVPLRDGVAVTVDIGRKRGLLPRRYRLRAVDGARFGGEGDRVRLFCGRDDGGAVALVRLRLPFGAARQHRRGTERQREGERTDGGAPEAEL